MHSIKNRIKERGKTAIQAQAFTKAAAVLRSAGVSALPDVHNPSDRLMFWIARAGQTAANAGHHGKRILNLPEPHGSNDEADLYFTILGGAEILDYSVGDPKSNMYPWALLAVADDPRLPVLLRKRAWSALAFYGSQHGEIDSTPPSNGVSAHRTVVIFSLEKRDWKRAVPELERRAVAWHEFEESDTKTKLLRNAACGIYGAYRTAIGEAGRIVLDTKPDLCGAELYREIRRQLKRLLLANKPSPLQQETRDQQLAFEQAQVPMSTPINADSTIEDVVATLSQGDVGTVEQAEFITNIACDDEFGSDATSAVRGLRAEHDYDESSVPRPMPNPIDEAEARLLALMELNPEERKEAVKFRENRDQQEAESQEQNASLTRCAPFAGTLFITSGSGRIELTITPEEVRKYAAQRWYWDLVLGLSLTLEEIEALLVGWYPTLFPEARIKELVAVRYPAKRDQKKYRARLRQWRCRADRKLTRALEDHRGEVEEFGESLDRRLDLLAFFVRLPRLLAIRAVTIEHQLVRCHIARTNQHWLVPHTQSPVSQDFDTTDVPSVRQQLIALSRKLLVFPLFLSGGWFDACRDAAIV